MNAIVDVGTAIVVGSGGRVLLKWHKLRRGAEDPPFSLENLRRGLFAGASLEIDTRALGDGDWVCLHDDTLDEETDGSGRVDAVDAEKISRLRIAGGDYPPPLLAAVAKELSATPPTGACLQIDLKQPREGISDRSAMRFAEIVGPVAERCLLSGTDWEAVVELGAAVPRLRLGFDPLNMAARRTLDRREVITDFVEEILRTAPSAAMFYLNYHFVVAALDRGINPIARLHEAGAKVDVWTLDPTTPGLGDLLPLIVDAGADQITSNDPFGLARSWSRLRPVAPAHP